MIVNLKNWVLSLAFAGLFLLFYHTVAGQEVSLRTNLAWDAVSEPNLGVEFSVSNHWSLGVDAGIKAWPRWLAWDWDKENPTHWRNFAVAPEVRYYLKEVFQGMFVGADALYTHYNVGNVPTPFHMYPEVEEYRLQGSFWAGGLLAGYAWWPWQHWRLELEAGAAVGLAAYDRFECAHCGTKLAEERRVGVVPKLAVNVAYNPVSKDKHQERKASVVVSGKDTLTALTPPVAFVVHLKEVQAPETTGDRLSKEYPWVIPIEKYRPLDYQSRPGSDSLQNVLFSVNSSELENTGRNAQVLKELTEAVNQIQSDARADELLISIVGLASIEGPRPLNDSLSVRRARAVAQYLQKETSLPGRNFEVIGKGEAWDWFEDQLRALQGGGDGLSTEDVEQLQQILRSTADADARESAIRADKALYRKVLDNLLRDQRSSGYLRVYYGNLPDPATEKLNGPIQKLLNAKRYHDAVREIEKDAAVMERVKENAEAMNAYGIAKYFTALDNKDAEAEKDAIGLIEKAAQNGSLAAAENLKGIETYGPARKEYEAWIEVMKEN